MVGVRAVHVDGDVVLAPTDRPPECIGGDPGRRRPHLPGVRTGAPEGTPADSLHHGGGLGISGPRGAPVLRVTEDLVVPEQALDTARRVTAWATEFISKEITGAFRLDEDLERAVDFGLERPTSALSPEP